MLKVKIKKKKHAIPHKKEPKCSNYCVFANTSYFIDKAKKQEFWEK